MSKVKDSHSREPKFSDLIIVRATEEKIKIQVEEIKSPEELKTEFGAMINHELMTPLFPILGYCKILFDSNTLGPLTSNQKRAIGIIYKNSKRLESLIRSLLDVQKLESNGMIFKKKDFDVKKMISELITNFDSQITNKNIDFIISMNSIIIHGDFERIKQVFVNLIENAIDFVPSKNGIIEINALEKDDHVLFHVKDNGVGISNENQKEIFKKFYQTDTSHAREHNGIGLGLVICQGIVEAHGGRIWCESKISKGTIFNFTISK